MTRRRGPEAAARRRGARPTRSSRSRTRSRRRASASGSSLPFSLALFEGLSPIARLARARATTASSTAARTRSCSSSRADGTPVFFRQRPADETEGDHDQEVRLSLSYYTEKLKGGGLSAVYVHDARGDGLSETELSRPGRAADGRLFEADATFDERIAAAARASSGVRRRVRKESDAVNRPSTSPGGRFETSGRFLIARRVAFTRRAAPRSRTSASMADFHREIEGTARADRVARGGARDRAARDAAASRAALEQLQGLEPRAGEPRAPEARRGAAILLDGTPRAARADSPRGRSA